ncbi:hypothetical protein O6H91_02G041200 [Diphasiastrum complanatum]|nr:hypothetical protein O6H91_02G041200 [Diphasiastrum complanatum]
MVMAMAMAMVEKTSSSLLLLLLFDLFLSICLFAKLDASVDADNAAVERFRSYLVIPSVHPNPNYAPAVEFLLSQAQDIGLDAQTFEFAENKPVLVLTWKGKNPLLPSVLLNSHMDVVPAEKEKWKHDPFAAVLDEKGDIYARGSQDMKCVGMQYLEAVRRLKAKGFKPLRTLHISFVPEEEVGGVNGAEKFVPSEEFKALNVAVVLDEGLASPNETYRVFNGERSPWWLVIRATGAPGHGSKLYDNSALENLIKSLDLISSYRASQFDLIKEGLAAEGEVVSVNPVFLKAGTPTPTGFVMNVQPSEAEAGFDIRLPPLADPVAFDKLIAEEWAPASRNLSFTFKQKVTVRNKKGLPCLTATDSSNPWWLLLKDSITKAGGSIGQPEIFLAATDARFVRDEGIPAFGFSPMANTPILLHDHNEFLNVREYLKGIDVYCEIIETFSSYGGPDDQSKTSSHTEL